MPEVITEEISLAKYPSKIAQPNPKAKLALGDLDGNALKLVYFLIREGVLQISPEEYDRLVAIYQIPAEKLTKEILADFRAILHKATITKPTPVITFIGDDLADRGMNDFYTLKIFEKLSLEGVKFSIIASNHSAQFLKQYAIDLNAENQTIFTGNNREFGSSLHNLQTLLKNSAVSGVSAAEIDQIMIKHYLPKLVLLTYEQVSEKELGIYSHAPIDAFSIMDIAEIQSVDFHDETSAALMQTIDHINAMFQRSLFASKKHLLLNMTKIQAFEKLLNDRYSDLEKAIKADPNLDYKRNYDVLNIHGHVGNEKPAPDVHFMWKFLNLDSQLGKRERQTDTYLVYTNNVNYKQVNIPEKNTPLDATETSTVARQNMFTQTPAQTGDAPASSDQPAKKP